jgi:hypothetical protein
MTNVERPAPAPRRQPRWRRRPGRSAILGLLALFLALACLYNLCIPLGEGPDEPGHLAYALFLTQAGRLPNQGASAAASDVPGEGHQPPLAYLLAAPAVAWLPADDRRIVLTANRAFRWAGGAEPAAFMRGSREYWPWPGLTLAWHLARLVSTLFGTATVLCTYLSARSLWPGRRGPALLAAALVALNPQFIFSSSLVSNDPLLAALAAAILWLSLRPARRPAAQMVALGLLFGLALLTKQSALLLGPLLLWAGWRAAPGRPAGAARNTLLWAATAALVAGWWYLRNWQLYGDLFGLAAFSAEFAGQPFDWRSPAAWGGALAQLFGSFWARFGWMTLPAPAWALWAYAAICLLAALGYLRPAAHRGAGPRGWAAGPLILLAMAGAWTLSFALTAGLVAWQGRMLFPAIGAAGILLAGGIWRLGRPTVAAALAPMLALAVWLPLAVIAPAYRWVVLPPAVAQAELGTPTYARYAQPWERGVVLRGWQLGGPARPGAALPITLTWNSLEPVPRSWTVFVHLVDSAGRIVAQSNSRPRSGALPFTRWTPGDWVADQHILDLPPDLPPGTYRLIVGLYRPEKGGMRQGVWAEDGRTLGDSADIGRITIAR